MHATYVLRHARVGADHQLAGVHAVAFAAQNQLLQLWAAPHLVSARLGDGPKVDESARAWVHTSGLGIEFAITNFRMLVYQVAEGCATFMMS